MPGTRRHFSGPRARVWLAAALLAVCVALVPTASAADSAPAAPTNATARLSFGISVSWVDNAVDETGYVIERTLGNQGYGVIGSVGANVTTFSDLAFGINTYTYRVRARNDRGFSDYATTAPISLISSSSTIPVTATAQPTSGTVPLTVTFSTTSTAPTITWYFGDGATATGATVTHTYTDFATYAATLIVLAPGVEGFGNDVGTSVLLIDAQAPPLSATSNLTASSQTRRTVTLNWTNPVSDATELLVVRCTRRKCPGPVILASLGASATTFTDTTAKSGTTYDYWLVARNAAGQTASSNVVSVKAR